ncbi:hypothetical protein ACSNOI_36280 [Actinomadura kijaniata]|uniref:hypothetical protein n=1 Tax=Actinomadura kijaniata TaxID=46161 RepID=UPI003F1D44C7
MPIVQEPRPQLLTVLTCGPMVLSLLGVTAGPAAARPPSPVAAPPAAAHRPPPWRRLTDVMWLRHSWTRSTPLRHHLAVRALRAHDVRWRSSGGCSDRDRVDCTSFEGIRWGTIATVTRLRQASGCPLTVSGGTERGHAPGPLSHRRGYKIDILPDRCTDRYITRVFRHVGERGDGAALYRSPDGVVFARESGHWDITVP